MKTKTKSKTDKKATSAKSGQKAAVKAVSKPAAKPKSAAKPAAKASVKPAAKSVAKAAVKKSVAQKVAPKTVKPVVKAPVKTSAKPVSKAASTAVPKAPTKTPAMAPPKSSSRPVTKTAAAKTAVPKAPSKAPLKASQTSAKPVPVDTSKSETGRNKASLTAIPKPAGKPAGRPSSRPVHQGMSSMADGGALLPVASYSSTMPLNQIDAPLPATLKKDPKLANNWKTKSGETLTDAELLAMPESEYMNDKQIAAFRVRLNQLKNDILANAGETTEHLREETVVVPDPADRATIEEEHALELRTRDRERKLLKKIEQSIIRLDTGDFGYCDETGEAIGVGRLLARPTATLSLEAQQRRELKQKMYGD
jgi:DnaK suppressor protein